MTLPPPLAIGDVRYVGDTVALVVAESRAVAEDACELVEVEYEPGQAVVDFATAAADTDNLVHAAWGLESNAMVATPFMPISGDLDEAFEAAAHVVECTIEQNRYICVPMETRGIIASWTPGRDEMEIVCATQSVHETRNFFARYLDIPEGSITVTAHDVGGGFGQKMFVFREECAVVLAARMLGQPVKWIEDRRENLLSAPHSRNELGKVRMAVDDDGIIQAITVEHKGDIGAYPACPAAMDARTAAGAVQDPAPRLLDVDGVDQHDGQGRVPRAVDVRDHRARDGDRLRRPRDRARPGRVPAQEPAVGSRPAAHRRRAATSSPRSRRSRRSSRRSRCSTTTRSARSRRQAREEGRLLGLGLSVYVEPTSMGGPTLHTEGATVRIESSGKVVAFLGTTSHGQSVETTMAQIVADTLGVGYDDVTVVQADTQSTPYGPGTGGSRTAVIAGGAAREATEAVREKVLQIAAHVMEASPDDLEIENSVVSVRGTPTRNMSLGDIAKVAYVNSDTLPPELMSGLEATVRFRPSRFPTWSNAAHACVVEIDPDTWLPTVKRYIVSEDCGNMINPNVVEGQVAGGVIQGLGGVLLEDFVYDADGNPLTSTFMDYLLPTAAEVPDLEIGHILSESTTNPGGFKGLGEGGAIGSHAAVANAVADALAHLGVRVTKTPLGPEDIFALVEAARS